MNWAFWKTPLFCRTPKVTEIPLKPLGQRCLEMTASFETSRKPPGCYGVVSGNFDGQGISVGALQWNLGTGTLMALLRPVVTDYLGEMKKVMDPVKAQVLADLLTLDRDQQLAWADTIQSARHSVNLPWRAAFQALGEMPAFQDSQVRLANHRFRWAARHCTSWRLKSQRAVALFFDIRVQNGSIGSSTQQRIRHTLEFGDLATMGPHYEQLVGLEPEVMKMGVIAHMRAEAANPRWVEDVRKRKLAIALGEGVVHGRAIHLERDFAITMERAVQGPDEPAHFRLGEASPLRGGLQPRGL